MHWFNIKYFELASACWLVKKANEVLIPSAHLHYLHRNQSFYFESKSNELLLYIWHTNFIKISNERNALAELPAKSHKIALIKCSEKAGLQDYLTKVSPTKNLSKLNPFGRWIFLLSEVKGSYILMEAFAWGN